MGKRLGSRIDALPDAFTLVETCQHGANDSTNVVAINTAIAGENALTDLTQPQSSFLAGASQLA